MHRLLALQEVYRLQTTRSREKTVRDKNSAQTAQTVSDPYTALTVRGTHSRQTVRDAMLTVLSGLKRCTMRTKGKVRTMQIAQGL